MLAPQGAGEGPGEPVTPEGRGAGSHLATISQSENLIIWESGKLAIWDAYRWESDHSAISTKMQLHTSPESLNQQMKKSFCRGDFRQFFSKNVQI